MPQRYRVSCILIHIVLCLLHHIRRLVRLCHKIRLCPLGDMPPTGEKEEGKKSCKLVSFPDKLLRRKGKEKRKRGNRKDKQ